MRKIISTFLILTFIFCLTGCRNKKKDRLIVPSENITVEQADSSSSASKSESNNSKSNVSETVFNDGKWTILKPSKYWKDKEYEVKVPANWNYAGDYYYKGTNKWWDEWGKEYVYSNDFYSRVYWKNKDKKDVMLVVSEYIGEHPFPDGTKPIGSTTRENMESIQCHIMDFTTQKFTTDETHGYITKTVDAKTKVGGYDTSKCSIQCTSPYDDGTYRYEKGYTVYLPSGKAVMYSFFDNTHEHSNLENINKTMDEMLELMSVK